jgi:hypothetical protein
VKGLCRVPTHDVVLRVDRVNDRPGRSDERSAKPCLRKFGIVGDEGTLQVAGNEAHSTGPREVGECGSAVVADVGHGCDGAVEARTDASSSGIGEGRGVRAGVEGCDGGQEA